MKMDERAQEIADEVRGVDLLDGEPSLHLADLILGEENR